MGCSFGASAFQSFVKPQSLCLRSSRRGGNCVAYSFGPAGGCPQTDLLRSSSKNNSIILLCFDLFYSTFIKLKNSSKVKRYLFILKKMPRRGYVSPRSNLFSHFTVFSCGDSAQQARTAMQRPTPPRARFCFRRRSEAPLST